MTKRFAVPFAATGDKTATPDATDPTGAISYSQGWGSQYQLPNSDPSYRPVGRQEMNGVLNDITGAVGELQSQGLPSWVLPTGLIPPYPFAAMVRHNFYNWRSVVGNNYSEPGTNSNWQDINPSVVPFASGVVATLRNFRMAATSAVATSTATADELIVKTALGGASFLLSSFSQAVNLSTVGAGGMDTGAAPVNGYVAIYAIYNPAGNVRALLAVNATSTTAPTIYGGANMPAGFTASALLTVVPTNASGQFKIFRALDRTVAVQLTVVYTSSSVVSFVPFSLSGVVPPNARLMLGELAIGSTAISDMTLVVVGDSSLIAQQVLTGTVSANKQLVANFSGVPISPNTPQTAVVASANTAGTPTFNIYVGGYEI